MLPDWEARQELHSALKSDLSSIVKRLKGRQATRLLNQVAALANYPFSAHAKVESRVTSLATSAEIGLVAPLQVLLGPRFAKERYQAMFEAADLEWPDDFRDRCAAARRGLGEFLQLLRPPEELLEEAIAEELVQCAVEPDAIQVFEAAGLPPPTEEREDWAARLCQDQSADLLLAVVAAVRRERIDRARYEGMLKAAGRTLPEDWDQRVSVLRQVVSPPPPPPPPSPLDDLRRQLASDLVRALQADQQRLKGHLIQAGLSEPEGDWPNWAADLVGQHDLATILVVVRDSLGDQFDTVTYDRLMARAAVTFPRGPVAAKPNASASSPSPRPSPGSAAKAGDAAASASDTPGPDTEDRATPGRLYRLRRGKQRGRPPSADRDTQFRVAEIMDGINKPAGEAFVDAYFEALRNASTPDMAREWDRTHEVSWHLAARPMGFYRAVAKWLHNSNRNVASWLFHVGLEGLLRWAADLPDQAKLAILTQEGVPLVLTDSAPLTVGPLMTEALRREQARFLTPKAFRVGWSEEGDRDTLSLPVPLYRSMELVTGTFGYEKSALPNVCLAIGVHLFELGDVIFRKV